MTDWDTISRLWREARSRDANDRSAFLDQACAGEPKLRRELELLLEPGADADEAPGWLGDGLQRLWEELKSTDDESPGQTTDRTTLEQRTHNILFKSSPFSILGAETLADLLSAMHVQEC